MDERQERPTATEPREIGAGWILLIAAWSGLVGGSLEALVFAKQRFYDGDVLFYAPDEKLWAAPVANTALALVLAGLLLLLRAVRARWVTPRAVLSVFVALAVLAPAMGVQFLEWWAAWLLAIGIAVQAGRLLAPRWRGMQLVVRVTLPIAVLAVIAAGVAVSMKRSRVTDAAIAALPESRTGAPNVLLIVLDTVRATHMSLHGYERETTPYLDRLAATSTVFDNAIATTSWTLPTHISLLTGLYRHETVAHWLGPMESDVPTLAEWFGSIGHRTYGDVGNLTYCDRAFGVSRGFAEYETYEMNAATIAHTSQLLSFVVNEGGKLLGRNELLWRKPADGIFDRTIAWIDRDRSRPFFAFLNLYDAHAPYLPPETYRDHFGPTEGLSAYDATYESAAHELAHFSDDEMRSAVNAYDGAILYLDTELERFLGQLDERGILDDTIVIVTSDHGEEFGEHGVVGHGENLYDESVQVPLLVRWPQGVAEGVRVASPVTLRDVPATIQRLVSPEEEPSLPGVPLDWTWSADDAMEPESWVIAQLSRADHFEQSRPAAEGDAFNVFLGDHNVVIRGDGRVEVYDRATDPGQHQDLAETELAADLVARAREALVRAGAIDEP